MSINSICNLKRYFFIDCNIILITFQYWDQSFYFFLCKRIEKGKKKETKKTDGKKKKTEMPKTKLNTIRNSESVSVSIWLKSLNLIFCNVFAFFQLIVGDMINMYSVALSASEMFLAICFEKWCRDWIFNMT